MYLLAALHGERIWCSWNFRGFLNTCKRSYNIKILEYENGCLAIVKQIPSSEVSEIQYTSSKTVVEVFSCYF